MAENRVIVSDRLDGGSDMACPTKPNAEDRASALAAAIEVVGKSTGDPAFTLEVARNFADFLANG